MKRTTAGLMALMLAGCMPEPGFDGAAQFAARCAGRHGAAARGQGPLAAGLDPAPPDLTMIAARNGGRFDSNEVAAVIDGLNRGAHFSSAMPVFGDGDLGPPIMTEEDGNPVPIPADLLALTEFLARLQRAPDGDPG